MYILSKFNGFDDDDDDDDDDDERAEGFNPINTRSQRASIPLIHGSGRLHSH